MQVNAKVITGTIAFCIAVTGVIVANMFMTMMIGEINRKRQHDRQVSYFGFTPFKTQRIFDEYRRSYPEGRL
jgi:hypothetical protein